MTIALRDEIQAAINRNSAENGSDTPDFVLANYLVACLSVFDDAVKAREEFYNRKAGSVKDPFPNPEVPPQPPCDNDHVAEGCEKFPE